VVMIFNMCKTDLVRFILIYFIFLMGFSQGWVTVMCNKIQSDMTFLS
jgi:hypothetical protein